MSLPDEQAALLRAIVSHPDDDTPRLVYADWLQENGSAEQAGFIRDSIALAAMQKSTPEREALVERLTALSEKHCYEWFEPLGLNNLVELERYHRGFPFRVSFGNAARFFAAADTLFEFVPVRGLVIDGGDFDNDSLPRFAMTPGLSRITDLRLYYHSSIAPEVWRELFRSPHLTGLTRLTLGNCGIFDAEMEELASAPELANLTSLDLGYNSVGVDGARALLDSPHLTKLKNLCLEHNFFGEEDGEEEVLEDWEKRLGDGLYLYGSPEDEEEEEVV